MDSRVSLVRTIVLAMAANAIAGVGTSSLLAQPPDFGGPIEVEQVEHRGEIVRVVRDGGAIEVRIGPEQFVVADLEHAGVAIPPAEIEFVKEEELSYLEPGMNVRFDAIVERGNKRITGEVSRFFVIGTIPPPRYGINEIFVEEAFDPVIPKAARASAPADNKKRIIGQVKGRRRDTLLVDIPDTERPGQRRTLQVKMADDAIVKLADIRQAREGDAIHIRGDSPPRLRDPMARPWFWATQVRVSRAANGGAKALGELPKRPGPPRPGGPPPGAPPLAATDDSSKPAPEKTVKYRGKILKIN